MSSVRVATRRTIRFHSLLEIGQWHHCVVVVLCELLLVGLAHHQLLRFPLRDGGAELVNVLLDILFVKAGWVIYHVCLTDCTCTSAL